MRQLVTILNFIIEVPGLFFAKVISWLRSATAGKCRRRNWNWNWNCNMAELFLLIPLNTQHEHAANIIWQ